MNEGALTISVLGSPYSYTASHSLQIMGPSCRKAPYSSTYIPSFIQTISISVHLKHHLFRRNKLMKFLGDRKKNLNLYTINYRLKMKSTIIEFFLVIM